MIPTKSLCPDCGSEEVVMTGKFGNGDAFLCNECGCTDFVSQPNEDDLDNEEMPLKSIKKSKLLVEEEDSEEFTGEGNLIKANKTSLKVVKVAKSKVSNTKLAKLSKVSKAVKGRKKK